MKRCLICLLLAGAVFSLGAQTTQTVSIYMPLVTGTGIDQWDNSFFYMLIYRDLETRDYIRMGRSASTSDFTLTGVLMPTGTNRISSLPEYRFDLYLQDRTGQVMLEQRYSYSNLENAGMAIDTMLDNIYRQIKPPEPPVQPVVPAQQPAEPEQPVPQPVRPVWQPPVQQPVQPAQQPTQPVQQPAQPVQEPAQPVQPTQQPVQEPAQPVQPAQQPAQQPVEQPTEPVVPVAQPVEPDQPPTPEDEKDWRNKWVYLGLFAAWNPRIYIGEYPAFNIINPNVGFYSEIQVLESVSLETGLGLTPEWITVSEEDEFRDLLLEIPILVKIVLKPNGVSGHYMLEPYSGVNLNFSLFRLTKPSQLSWVVGYQHGVRAGQGAFLFDFRFTMDLGKSALVKYPDTIYQRYGMSIGIGYKYGLMDKK